MRLVDYMFLVKNLKRYIVSLDTVICLVLVELIINELPVGYNQTNLTYQYKTYLHLTSSSVHPLSVQVATMGHSCSIP